VSFFRTGVTALAFAVATYTAPKYGWPIVLEHARAQLRDASPAPAPEPPKDRPPIDEEGWTGVLLTPTVELTARFDAKLASVRARVGDHVRSGDLLAELDTTVQKHEIAAAEAGVRASRAEAWQASVALAQARDRQARRDGVVKVGNTDMPLTSGEEQASARFDSAAASGRLSSASATAQERRARLAQLRASLDEAHIRAPFDGTIAARYFEPGAHVRAGVPLVRIVGRGALRARFAVPEADARAVSVGTHVVLAWDDRRHDATVDRVAPEVESASGTVFVEATVPGTEDVASESALSGRVITVSRGGG
jgi:RND family efflux transporter MFP subunit